jgi:hypothetical protein
MIGKHKKFYSKRDIEQIIDDCEINEDVIYDALYSPKHLKHYKDNKDAIDKGEGIIIIMISDVVHYGINVKIETSSYITIENIGKRTLTDLYDDYSIKDNWRNIEVTDPECNWEILNEDFIDCYCYMAKNDIFDKYYSNPDYTPSEHRKQVITRLSSIQTYPSIQAPAPPPLTSTSIT